MGFPFAAALKNGERARLLPIECLARLREELANFKRAEELNAFQKWILEGLYDLEAPADFPATSILLVAVPHPFYAQVELERGGRRYGCLSLVASDFAATEASLRSALPEGSRLVAAEKLPLKRLAVQGGLAEYGRNNICYIAGLGSAFSLSAFFSDLPCEEGSWREALVSSTCSSCTHCLSACPTGAIREGRFLIDNERCLSFLNEGGDPFPSWLDEAAHHCLYDCLRCQVGCPMNKGQEGKTVGPIVFTEAETEILLAGLGFESYPPDLARKASYLGLQRWPAGLAKNLRALIALGLQAPIRISGGRIDSSPRL
jgi:epoxyqueuosine reductase